MCVGLVWTGRWTGWRKRGRDSRYDPALAQLEAETQRLVETIAGNAPLSVRASKAGIHEIVQKGSLADLEMVAARLRQCVTSEDFREGQAAFREKRQPVFKGR